MCNARKNISSLFAAWAFLYAFFYIIGSTLPYYPELRFFYVIESRIVCTISVIFFFYILSTLYKPTPKESIIWFVFMLSLVILYYKIFADYGIYGKIEYILGNIILSIITLFMLFHLGALLSMAFRTPAMIVPVLLLTPIIDIYSVFLGPTHTIVTKHPDILKLFLFSFPLLSQKKLAPMIGLSDLTFISFLILFSEKQGYSIKKNIISILICLIMGYVLIYFTRGMPLFPFLCIAFFAVNYKELFKDKRYTKQVTIITAGVVITVTIFFAIYNYFI